MHTAVNGMLRDIYGYSLKDCISTTLQMDGPARVNLKVNEKKMNRVPKEAENTDEGELGCDVPERPRVHEKEL